MNREEYWNRWSNFSRPVRFELRDVAPWFLLKNCKGFLFFRADIFQLDCLRPSSVVSLNEDASRILEDSFFTLVSLLCFQLPSKFSSNVVEIRAWNSKSVVRSTNFYLLSRGKLIVGFENRAFPSRPPFHHSPSFLRSCSNAIFHLLLPVNRVPPENSYYYS